MVEADQTLNQRREDRDNPIIPTAQTAMALLRPALKFQVDMILLWARGVQMMAQTVTSLAEKIKES